MKKTRISAVLTLPLLFLFGCQPDAPAQQASSTSAVPASPAVEPAQPGAQAVPAAKPETAKTAPESGVASSATDARALAQKSGCFTCHMIDKKLVGPAWNDVAAKYRGQKAAEAMLIAKVAGGGQGVWGTVPMPPNAPRINENDIKTLVRFILGLK